MKTKLQQMAEAAESSHPAQRASFLSIKNVKARDKAGWLSLFAEDGIVQDPVGPSPLDPSGQGHRGKEAMGRFWDMIISGGSFEFEMLESFPCGDECANYWLGVNNRPDGTVYKVPMMTVYKVNPEGKLLFLKAYWDRSLLNK